MDLEYVNISNPSNAISITQKYQIKISNDIFIYLKPSSKTNQSRYLLTDNLHLIWPVPNPILVPTYQQRDRPL